MTVWTWIRQCPQSAWFFCVLRVDGFSLYSVYRFSIFSDIFLRVNGFSLSSECMVSWCTQFIVFRYSQSLWGYFCVLRVDGFSVFSELMVFLCRQSVWFLGVLCL